MGHEIITGAVEAALGAFGDADVEDFGKSGALGPIDQSPFTEKLDVAGGNHELGCGNGAGVHTEGLSMGVKRNSSQALRARSSGPSSATSVVSMESRITPSTVAWGTGLAA
jgi:hypothetical protein